MSKIYIVNPPLPISIKPITSKEGHLDLKKYTLPFTDDIESEEVHKNTDYHIVYDNDDLTYYKLFKVCIECHHLVCKGVEFTTFSFFHPIHVDFFNQQFTIYSNQIKETTTITVKNEYNINLSLSNDQVIYYPIYIVAKNEYSLADFITIYPHLVKDIFKFKHKYLI